MRAVIRLAILLLIPTLAHAHAPGSASAHSAGWTYDPKILVPVGLTGLLYLVGSTRLWRRAGFGHGARLWQALSFWGGWIALALALLSPLHHLGEKLFVAHMLEHEILMVIAAPLLVLARPGPVMLWALPPA